jgi:hypothetical protein
MASFQVVVKYMRRLIAWFIIPRMNRAWALLSGKKIEFTDNYMDKTEMASILLHHFLKDQTWPEMIRLTRSSGFCISKASGRVFPRSTLRLRAESTEGPRAIKLNLPMLSAGGRGKNGWSAG